VIRRSADEMFEQRVQALTATLREQMELYDAEQRTLQVLLHIYYLRQDERSERWRRLRDWSFCPSFRVCVFMMTHNSSDVIVPIAQAAITFPSFSPAAKPLFFLPLLSLL